MPFVGIGASKGGSIARKGDLVLCHVASASQPSRSELPPRSPAGSLYGPVPRGKAMSKELAITARHAREDEPGHWVFDVLGHYPWPLVPLDFPERAGFRCWARGMPWDPAW